MGRICTVVSGGSIVSAPHIRQAPRSPQTLYTIGNTYDSSINGK